MSEATVIGLGEMGAALAHTLLRNGYSVTVWNRTAAKAEPLVQAGAALAANPAEAIAASSIVIVCVASYETTQSVLADVDLRGRLLIELSTATPKDAEEGQARARSKGAEYLDGAIMATPRQIGTPEAPILVSGPETAFRRAEPLLKVLAGATRHVGEPIGAAAAWDLALLSYAFGGLIGFIHGVRIFESEGMPVEDLTAMVAEFAPVMGEFVRYEGEVIKSENYGNPESTVRTCFHAAEMMVKQARQRGISDEFPVFFERLFRKAVDAGYGDEQAGALIKVLRAAGSREDLPESGLVTATA